MNGPLGDYCTRRQDARARRAPLARRALAGDPGRRGAHRHRRHRRPDRRRRSATPTASTARRPAARSASRWPTRCTPTTSSSSPTTSCRSPACPGRSRGTTWTTWSWWTRSATRPRSSPARPRSPRARTGCSSPRWSARFIRDAGIMRDGFSFQAGAGGTALAFAVFLQEMMKERGRARRASSAAARRKYLVEMLEEGLTDYILDGQTFDLRRRALHAGRTRGHVTTTPVHLVQLPRQGELRHAWWTPSCSARPRWT